MKSYALPCDEIIERKPAIWPRSYRRMRPSRAAVELVWCDGAISEIAPAHKQARRAWRAGEVWPVICGIHSESRNSHESPRRAKTVSDGTPKPHKAQPDTAAAAEAITVSSCREINAPPSRSLIHESSSAEPAARRPARQCYYALNHYSAAITRRTANGAPANAT